MLDQTTLITVGFTLILSGFIVSFVAVFLLFFRGVRGRRKTRGGGLIMIGPIPIVFGTDKETVRILIALSIVLMIIVLAFMLLPRIIV